jgi:hypothetical protein
MIDEKDSNGAATAFLKEWGKVLTPHETSSIESSDEPWIIYIDGRAYNIISMDYVGEQGIENYGPIETTINFETNKETSK